MLSNQFLVYDTHFENDELVVGGVANLGSITRRMTFTLLRTRGSGEQKANFFVKKILAYRRELNEIGSGMTASLFVVGEGAENIKEYDMLEG